MALDELHLLAYFSRVVALEGGYVVERPFEAAVAAPATSNGLEWEETSSRSGPFPVAAVLTAHAREVDGGAARREGGHAKGEHAKGDGNIVLVEVEGEGSAKEGECSAEGKGVVVVEVKGNGAVGVATLVASEESKTGDFESGLVSTYYLRFGVSTLVFYLLCSGAVRPN